MELLYLSIGILILAAMLIYSLTKRSAGWLRGAQLVFYIAVAVLSTIIYLDAKNLNTQFFTADNLLLLEEGGMLLSGIHGRVSEDPQELPESELARLQLLRDRTAYAEMRGERYKLFLFQSAAFADLTTEIPFGDVNLTEAQALEVLRAGDALEEFAQIVVAKRTSDHPESAKETIKRRFSSAAELKAKLFSAIIATATTQYGKAFIPVSYRKRTVTVVPATPYFLFIRFAPQFAVDLVVKGG